MAPPGRVLSGRLTVTVGETQGCVHLWLLLRLLPVLSGSLLPSSLHYFFLASAVESSAPRGFFACLLGPRFVQGRRPHCPVWLWDVAALLAAPSFPSPAHTAGTHASHSAERRRGFRGSHR